MVLISFTNIVVDEFSYGKKQPFNKYIYFLTHMHSGNLIFIKLKIKAILPNFEKTTFKG